MPPVPPDDDDKGPDEGPAPQSPVTRKSSITTGRPTLEMDATDSDRDQEPTEGTAEHGDLRRPTRVVPVSTERPTQELEVSDTESANQDSDDQDGLSMDLVLDGKLIERTEDLAGRAFERLKSEVHLPNVLEEAEDIARTMSAIRSPALSGTVALYILTASLGVAATAVEGLHDWYMHLAMYVVVLSFLILYVKSHLMRKPIARALYGVITVGLMVFFAWVLHDLVPARLVVDDGEAIERPIAQLLDLPAVMLLVVAAGVLVHGLFLARGEARR